MESSNVQTISKSETKHEEIEIMSKKRGNMLQNKPRVFLLRIGFLGMKIKKKGLINGLILSLLYILINLIIGLNLNNIISIFKFTSKIILIILGTIIGVNLNK